ncbi:MAG: hypothetical protein AAB331_02980, partial [Planctomycetota bacterium]
MWVGEKSPLLYKVNPDRVNVECCNRVLPALTRSMRSIFSFARHYRFSLDPWETMPSQTSMIFLVVM